MTDSQLDELFKNQLPGHESPVEEDMWERIMRKKDKDRKGFFFFLSLVGLFLLGFGVAGILLFQINKRESLNDGKRDSYEKAFSDTTGGKTAETDSDLKRVPSINKESSFGMDSTLDMERRDHDIPKAIPLQRSYTGSLQASLKHPNRPPETEQASSISDTTTTVMEIGGSPDSTQVTGEKSNPVFLLTRKPANTDSLKPVSQKKSDSTNKRTGDKWSLDLYASPDYPIDHNKQEYLQGKLSYTIGLRINRSFGKHFSGKAGIQFSQLNYALPDTSGIPGVCHLTRLDVPVLAGYSWGTKTFGMTVNAGIIFNRSSWLRPDSINYIKTNTGLSLYLGFNFSKQITQRIDIFSEPYYRYQLSSMVVSPNYFPKYMDVVGISFGVRYHFKK
jgi:hypothetical protein